MAASIGAQKTTFSSSTLHNLCRKIPNSLAPRSLPANSSPTLFKTLMYPSQDRGFFHPNRSFAVRAESNKGVEPRYFDYDLFTIGAGSGRVRASRLAASYGASVAICELPFANIASDSAGVVGGTCVLQGCVPKKLLVYASKYSHDFEESHGFGWKYESDPKHDWSTLMANKNAELHRLSRIYQNILKNAGVTLIEGHGKTWMDMAGFM